MAWRRTAWCTAALLLAACGGGGAREQTLPASGELTGLIVAVDGADSDVRAFELEADGRVHVFRIAGDVAYGFDLAHLHEHERLEQPVRVRFETRAGAAYALAIDDA